MVEFEPRRQAGFTLIELTIALAVLAIVAGIGVPRFSSLLSDGRSRALTNDLVLALQLGRSEALRRGRPIRLCALEGCGASLDWSRGWRIREPGEEEMLREWAPGQASVTVAAERPEIEFDAMGRVAESFTVSLEVRGIRRRVEVRQSGLVRALPGGETDP